MDQILKASYGDIGQRERNRRVPDPQQALAIYEAAKQRKHLQPNPEVPLKDAPGPASPPFWNRKVNGTAYGDFNRVKPKQAGKAAVVEIRPGVMQRVPLQAEQPPLRAPAPHQQQQQQQQQQQHHAAQRPPSGQQPQQQRGQQVHPSQQQQQKQQKQPEVPQPRGRSRPGAPPSTPLPGVSPAPPQPAPKTPPATPQCALLPPPAPDNVAAAYEINTIELAPAVAALEVQMRAAVAARATVHVTKRTVLLRAFGKVLKKDPAALGPRDKVTLRQFQEVWAALGLAVTWQMAAALFNKHGQDAKGLLPAMVFIESMLLTAPRHLMVAAGEVQKRPYQAGQPATHTGKIQYRQCKRGVWPPSNWDPAVAVRSAQLPEAEMELEFVHGFDGHLSTSNNLVYNCQQQVLYTVAALVVVYDKPSHTQRFFQGHDDDVTCLALAPDKRVAASGQLGKDPVVLVWDSLTLATLQRLQHGYGFRGVQAVSFSSSGSKLASITLDNSHTCHIWDVTRGTRLLDQKSQPGAPPAVYGIEWSWFEPDRLVTYGQNHIKFWQLQRGGSSGGAAAAGGGRGSSGGGAAPGKAAAAAAAAAAAGSAPPNELSVMVDAGVFGRGSMHSVLSACFLPSGIVLTGSPAGTINTWQGPRWQREVAAHGRGPATRRPDGTESYSGVRCLVLLSGAKRLLSAGADGVVVTWDVSKGDLGAPLQRMPLLTAQQQPGASIGPSIVALASCDGTQLYAAGTSTCDVWEVDADPRILIHGQQADLYGLAVNPRYTHVYATMCDSNVVTIWSAATHKPIRILHTGGKCACSGAFSPDGQLLAVGLRCGGVKVYEFHPTTRQVWWGKVFNTSVDDLKFSPCGTFLAAAGHDQVVTVLDITRGYTQVAKCGGHTSAVRHLDWAADSSAIQSTDQAYELLYHDPHTGKQLRDSMRDAAWATWSIPLGFPVMGIWPDYSDGTDVNAVDRSPSGRWLLTADDLGKVKLFNHPCVVEDAPGRMYGGHSSHVMNVKWLADERWAVSVGGRDRAVFQWRLVPPLTQQEKAARRLAEQQVPLVPCDQEGLVWQPAPAVGGLCAQRAPGGRCR